MKKASKAEIWGGVFIVLAVFIAYLPALSGGFIWDDDAYVTQNPLLTAPDGLKRIWFSAQHQSQYFPLIFTTLRLEYNLWGLNPLDYHIVNVLLHSVNALLVWLVLRRLALPGAWLAAAIFALHPVQVETVAWITELKNTESTFFYLLALLAWMKFAGTNAWRFYALTFLLYALALFGKTTACTLPAAMLLVLWLKREPVNWQRWIQLVPFLAAGLAMGLLSIWWEKHLGNYQAKYGLSFSLLQRLLIATHAVWFYAGKLIWPVNLTFSYPLWDINPGDPWQYAGLLGCITVAMFLWRWRQALGRGPITAVIFFVAVLSPLLGFIPLFTFLYTFVADHYQYLACLGPIALFAGAATHFSEKWRISPSARHALAFFLLLVLAILTWRQAGAYQNLESLWHDTLKKNPGSWMAHTNLGRLLTAQGNLAEAEIHYREALRLKPDNEDVHYNYGNMLARAGRLDEAVTQYRQALQLNPTDPEVYNNLGVIFYQEHRQDEAIACFHEALRYKPDYPDAHYNLGNALFMEHKFDEAVGEYREALRLEPDSVAIKNRLRALGVPTN
jgi:tetratricopeptide (TPR) repeat protein